MKRFTRKVVSLLFALMLALGLGVLSTRREP